MKLKSYKFLLALAVTFVIVFLMNYIGNAKADRLETALMNGVGGALGLTIGMYIYNRSKNDKTPPQHFD